MGTIKWTPEMSLGIPAMDSAHEKFLQDLIQLAELADDKFGAAFLALIAHVECDFREEEQLMEDIDYPCMQDHLEQHARVLSALHHIAPRVMAGDIVLGRDATSLLPQWFSVHLATMDTALAFALELARAEGRGATNSIPASAPVARPA
jgi:hemerythrin